MCSEELSLWFVTKNYDRFHFSNKNRTGIDEKKFLCLLLFFAKDHGPRTGHAAFRGQKSRVPVGGPPELLDVILAEIRKHQQRDRQRNFRVELHDFFVAKVHLAVRGVTTHRSTQR